MSRGSLPSARGPQPLYRMRRPTARIAWTVQPMRPPQRDREAESPAASLLPGTVVCEAGLPAAGVLRFLKQAILPESRPFAFSPARCQPHTTTTTQATPTRPATMYAVIASVCGPGSLEHGALCPPLSHTDSTGRTGTHCPSCPRIRRSGSQCPGLPRAGSGHCISPSVRCHVTPDARMHDDGRRHRHRQQASSKQQQAAAARRPQTTTTAECIRSSVQHKHWP